MALSKEREGEIAVMFVKVLLRKHGVELSRNMVREIGSAAKVLGVSVEELREFTAPILHEFVEEVLGAKEPLFKLSGRQGGGH